MREQYIENIGLVRMTKQGRAKRNYNLKILPDNVVQVSIPPGGSYEKAMQIVMEMKEKIIRHQKKIREKVQPRTVFDFNTEFKTHFHTLKLKSVADFETTQVRVSNGVAEVWISGNDDVSSDDIQDFIRECIERLWKHEAKYILPERVKNLARANNFNFQSVKINSARTRWGSCSSVDNINFSLHLMMLPDELIDYIILHELCHTVHKNHGKDFYALLDNVTNGKHEELNAKLKDYRIGVY